jgi:hypothetical protein
MRVDPKHGRCRECRGTLDIVDADDCSMTVECQNAHCREVYDVEPDAFGDGCMLYHFSLMVERLDARDDA